MNIVLCDDEPVYLETLRNAVSAWAQSRSAEHAVNILTYRSSEELLEQCEAGLEIHLLFMDIQFWHEEDGMQAVRRIHLHDPNLPVVFITNYGEYVYEGYTVNALRYLRKPAAQADIDECLDIVWHRYSLSQHNAILFQTQAETLRLQPDTILSAEALGHMTRIRTTDESGEYSIRMRFGEIMKLLPAGMFAQCHRSYIVNLLYVRRFTHRDILLSNGDLIPISRTYMPSFIQLFRSYYQGGWTD